MRITTVSKWLGDVTATSKLLSKRKIFVIPNGIDTETFQPTRPLTVINGINISDKKIILGVANSWSDSKGLSDFRKLAQEISDDFIIVLVGIRKEQETDMPANIICIERTDSVKALAEFYSTALVYFNASVEETFGLTTIEAMSCGTPVITYQATACAEPVTSDTGIVLQPHDVKGVWDAIYKISNRGKDFYSKACRSHAVEKYDASEIYERYINMYFNELEGDKC